MPSHCRCVVGLIFLVSVFTMEDVEKLKFARGTQNNVTCNFDGPINASFITWFSSDLSSVDFNPTSRVFQDNSTGTLTFTSMSLNDSGRYTCLISCSKPSSRTLSSETSTRSQHFDDARGDSQNCSSFSVEILVYEMPDYVLEVIFLLLLNAFLGVILLVFLVRNSMKEKKVVVYDTL